MLNTLFGYAVFVALLMAGLGMNLALVLATVAGVLFNFQTIGGLVFRRREWRRIVRFVLGYGFVLGRNIVVLGLLVTAGLHPAAGQALLLPFVAIMSFLINKLIVFES